MTGFISGMVTMGYVIAGLFFLKFWTRARDLFFLAFAAAFALLAVSQALLSDSEYSPEQKSWFYLVRLAAFAAIVVAIVHKNLRRRD